MSDQSNPTLADRLLHRLVLLLEDAEAKTRPLEIDPCRGQLFELFVIAHGAGYTRDDGEVDLTADGICRELSHRWGLDSAARASVAQQAKLPPQQLSKMRLLWSLMRMWMEWSYAWSRWPEFHQPVEASETNGDSLT